MQGIELVAIFSLLSSLFSLFSAPSSLLSSALDSRNRIPAFLQGIMRPRGLPPCRNAAIRDGPGANKPCCQSIWGSLAAFFVISSLFSLLSFLCSLPSSLPGADPFRYHPALLGPNLCVLPPSHLDRACFSLLASLFSLLSSRFSLLSALFPLLSLLLISQIALRTCPFDLCIRPSTSPPTASTLCGSLPGPAECAKRLNPATEPSGRR